ncbi:hypothetical protein D3OALGA1CA_5502 [Olavius algarvensis associated proteobacterium Delta 3]|nr:hypothetical protein D3OALGB2SA_1346 [Olavius algarvensis associated proteobacterium Delta 3]CAB5167714.1 hypothetical protein D3OALGA1CA_5502 [Olavius algarvensis associated proteobacterium Delta 3]
MGWKIYAWLITILFILAKLTDPEFYTFSAIELTRTLLSCLLIFGTFSFAYRKATINPNFWKIVLVMSVLDELWDLIESLMEHGISTLSVFSFGLGFALVVPSFIAVYLYSFKSNHLWETNSVDSINPKRET